MYNGASCIFHVLFYIAIQSKRINRNITEVIYDLLGQLKRSSFSIKGRLLNR